MLCYQSIDSISLLWNILVSCLTAIPDYLVPYLIARINLSWLILVDNMIWIICCSRNQCSDNHLSVANDYQRGNSTQYDAVFSFTIEECIYLSHGNRHIHCPVHNDIHLAQVAPDTVNSLRFESCLEWISWIDWWEKTNKLINEWSQQMNYWTRHTTKMWSWRFCDDYRYSWTWGKDISSAARVWSAGRC